jgi:putative endonuclease
MMPPSPSRPKSKARIAAYIEGHRGESLAALYLRLKLYRVLERRYKTPVGEIDLIVERFGTVAFVEVKARSRAASEGQTLESVNARRIRNAAEYWMARHPESAQGGLRLDVVFLTPGRWPTHIRDAF